MKIRTTAAVMVLTAVACGIDLRVDHPFDGNSSGSGHVRLYDANGTWLNADGGRVAGSAGVISAVVDATSKTSIIYFDMDEGRELSSEEAFDAGTWDLAFQRYNIATNGGAGGPGNVGVAVLKEKAFDAVTMAPETGYLQDTGETVFNGVEGGWYYYDLGVHRLLTQGDRTYVVRTGNLHAFKLRMRGYYDDAGTPAMLSFDYQSLGMLRD